MLLLSSPPGSTSQHLRVRFSSVFLGSPTIKVALVSESMHVHFVVQDLSEKVMKREKDLDLGRMVEGRGTHLTYRSHWMDHQIHRDRHFDVHFSFSVGCRLNGQ